MTRTAASFLLAILLLPACEPEDAPRYSPDGKRIALLKPSARIKPSETLKDPSDLCVLDPASKKFTELPLPDGWSAGGMTWAGDKMLVRAYRPIKAENLREGEAKLESTGWLIDPSAADEKARFKKVELPVSLIPPFVAPYQGRDAIYVSDMQKERTVILSLDTAKELGTLDYEVDHAGSGWIMRKIFKDGNNGLTKDLVRVELVDAKGRDAGRLNSDEIAKACFRGVRAPMCASISSDGKTIVLGFETDTIFRRHSHEYTFGVFDIAGGKFHWGGDSNPITGIPVLLGDNLYVLEAKSRQIDTGDRTISALGEGPARTRQPTDEVVLAHHTKDGRRVICDLPLAKGDEAARYSASPDRKTFVLQVTGKRPRLLLVPIKDSTKADDVTVIDLPR